MDKRLIVIVSAVAFFTGVIIYLTLPRDLERDISDLYLYGRKEILYISGILMMFGGAFGVVYGMSNTTMNPPVLAK